MKLRDIQLNKKTMTKLLQKDFRKKILDSVDWNDKDQAKKIAAYAQYVVDSQIIQRISEYKDDRKSGWGFPQLNLLCCVKKDGTIEKKFFEFKQVNHFLKDKDGDSAVEVVKCILLLWSASDDSIEDFDYEKIDKELVRIDKEVEEKQKKEKKIDDTGAEIKRLVEPIVNQQVYEQYEVASTRAKEDIEKILKEMKIEKKIFSYVVSLSRNTEETIEKNNLFIDIGYKLEEKDEYTVLACHIRPQTKSEAK